MRLSLPVWLIIIWLVAQVGLLAIIQRICVTGIHLYLYPDYPDVYAWCEKHQKISQNGRRRPLAA